MKTGDDHEDELLAYALSDAALIGELHARFAALPTPESLDRPCIVCGRVTRSPHKTPVCARCRNRNRRRS